jgi:hypothetical protein
MRKVDHGKYVSVCVCDGSSRQLGFSGGPRDLAECRDGEFRGDQRVDAGDVRGMRRQRARMCVLR